jgi:hypothetical protein
MEKVNQIVKPLDKYAQRVPQLVDVAKKVGVEPALLLGAGLLIAGLVILVTMGSTILTIVITVLYPSMKSIQALETNDTDDDDKVWLTYWIIFGMASLLDEFGGIILSIIPMYYFVKLGFFVYLMHPKTDGARFVYGMIIKPILEKNKHKIQAFIDEIKGSAGDVISEAKNAAKERLNDPTLQA